jgi:hypothetical protein
MVANPFDVPVKSALIEPLQNWWRAFASLRLLSTL